MLLLEVFVIKGGEYMIGLKICDWLEEQSYWEQCIGDAILKGKSLSSEELDEIYQLLKKEFNRKFVLII